MQIVSYKITRSDKPKADFIRVQHNNQTDATAKLSAYFSKPEDAHMIPGLSLWALHDNSPKNYRPIIRFTDSNGTNFIISVKLGTATKKEKS